MEALLGLRDGPGFSPALLGGRTRRAGPRFCVQFRGSGCGPSGAAGTAADFATRGGRARAGSVRRVRDEAQEVGFCLGLGGRLSFPVPHQDRHVMARGLLTLAGPQGLAGRPPRLPVVNKVLAGGELARGAVTAAARLPPRSSDSGTDPQARRAPKTPRAPRAKRMLSGPSGKLAPESQGRPSKHQLPGQLASPLLTCSSLSRAGLPGGE